MKKCVLWTILFLWGIPALTTTAGEADVVNVLVTHLETGQYRFDVTVAHQDEGWHHYADKWEILGPDGAVLATRVLHHPHENEQPFTRSLNAVAIPDGINTVTVRSHDSQHKFGGAEKTVPLPAKKSAQ